MGISAEYKKMRTNNSTSSTQQKQNNSTSISRQYKQYKKMAQESEAKMKQMEQSKQVAPSPEAIKNLMQPKKSFESQLKPVSDTVKNAPSMSRFDRFKTAVNDVKNKVLGVNKFVGDAAHAADAAALNTATFGLSDKAINKFVPKVAENIKKVQSEHPIATKTGEVAGYAVPFGAVETGLAKVGGKVIEKVGSNLGKRLILGSGSGAVVGAAESAVKGEDVKDIGKNAAIGAGMGAGGELVGAGLSKAIKLLKRPFTSKYQPEIEQPNINSSKEQLPRQNGVKTVVDNTEVPKQFKGDTGILLNSGIDINPSRNFNRPTNTSNKFTFESKDMESTYKTSKGVTEPSMLQKVKSGISDALHMFTRPVSSLPVTKENAELYKELTRLPKIKNITGDDTIRVIDDITKDLDKNSFDMFSRKVLLNDLAQEVKLGNKLPEGFTPENVQHELNRLDNLMPEEVKNAVENRRIHWDSVKNDYINAMDSIGVDVKDKFQREDYFRHQVLEYMQDKGVYGTGEKLQSPTNRGFSKARTGQSIKAINTDYLQSEYEVMAQMKHDTEVAKTIKNIETNYDVSAKIKADAKQQGLKDWHEAIPEGYTTWQPREGNVFYMADSIPSKIADQLTEGLLKEANLTSEEISKVLAVGGKRKEFVVKNEVADTLNNLLKNQPTNALSKASSRVMNTWKKWVLTVNPRSVVKYNIRNFTGDLDPIIAGNPSTLTKIPKASQELFDAFKKGKFTPELKSWYDKGGFQELLYSQEIGDINKLAPFQRFEKTSLTDIAKSPFKKYTDITSSITNYREAVGRYASYLDYLDQLKAGKLKNYGASKREVVDGLKNIEDKAYKLSNDLLGAYDEISEAGQTIRKHLIPFYSWLEVNMKRYKQLFQNAIEDGTTSEKIGKTALQGLKLAPKVAFTVGKTALSAYALTGVLSLWNELKYSDLEDTLPDDVKSKPHIILGKDKDGNTLYFSRLGALNDFLEWFGLDTAQQDVKDILDRKKTLKEQAIDMIKSPINKVAGSITPAIKTPAEIATGKKLYPDVFKPGNVRDKTQYAAQSLGVGKEYDALTSKPHRPYLSSLSEALLYKSDPGEASYYKILDAKNKFTEKTTGLKKGNFSITGNAKTDALYNYKLALKYDDKKAAIKYLELYNKYGGTDKGLKQSLNSLDPLYGLDYKEEEAFKKTLSAKDLNDLNLALKYYEEILK